MSDTTDQINRSRTAYIFGFAISLLLTLTAFFLADRNLLSHSALIGTITVLALFQFATQMYFFLHLGQESKPRLKLITFWFMLLVVLILVLGSLWIMNNLNYNMDPNQVNKYLNGQDGL